VLLGSSEPIPPPAGGAQSRGRGNKEETYMMQKRIVTLLVAITVALLVLLASGRFRSLTANEGGQSLEGSWGVMIMPDQPPSGFPPEGVLNLATFMPDGGFISSDGYIADSLYHGTWVRTGNRKFGVTCLGLSYGASGNTEATFKMRATLAYTGSRSEVTGRWAIDIFDGTGNKWITVSTGKAQMFPINVEKMP
jgi:hypothetical protein